MDIELVTKRFGFSNVAWGSYSRGFLIIAKPIAHPQLNLKQYLLRSKDGFRYQIPRSMPAELQATLSSTTVTVLRLVNGHQDLYKFGTRQEKAHICIGSH